MLVRFGALVLVYCYRVGYILTLKQFGYNICILIFKWDDFFFFFAVLDLMVIVLVKVNLIKM